MHKMEITKGNIISEIRHAIDDIAPSITDSFTDNTDDELWQAVQHAVGSLLMELPIDLLEPVLQENPVIRSNDWDGYIMLDDDFLRFVSLDVGGWIHPVYELIEPGSDEEKRQSSSWGRATEEKPKAMLTYYPEDGKRCLRYWGTNNPVVNHLLYIPMYSVENGTISCALKEAAKPMVIYRSAAIFFEGKKDSDTADKFKNLITA